MMYPGVNKYIKVIEQIYCYKNIKILKEKKRKHFGRRDSNLAYKKQVSVIL